MCNKVNMHEFLLVVRSRIFCFAHAILFICSLWNLYPVSYLMCSLFLNLFTECLRWQENVLLWMGTWFCSMITSSENATPLTLLRWWIISAIVRSKSTRIFIPKTTVIYSTSMISVIVVVSLKKTFSKIVLNISLTIWQYTYKAEAYSKSPQNSKKKKKIIQGLMNN